jgi:putative ABC transport system substrate-binding protein
MIRTRLALSILLFVSGLVAPLGGEAQQTPRVPRICYLFPGPPGTGVDAPAQRTWFLAGLRDLGYVEGQTITIDRLYAEGHFDRFPSLVAECLRRKPDIIIAGSTPATVAARDATRSVPIVMTPLGDPVATGLVASLARPGGNVTGQTFMATGLGAKRLELLKEAVPGISKVSVLSNPPDPIAPLQMKELQKAAPSLGVALQVRGIREPADFSPAFAATLREGAQGLLVTAETIFLTHRARILEFAARHRLPAIYTSRGWVDDGGLMSYGPVFSDQYRRVATYVDNILKGARPSDLPVEHPTKFELVLNLKTAKALGLTIPASVLARADQVIE